LLRDERFTPVLASVVVGVCGGLLALGFRALIDVGWWLFARVRALDSVLSVLLVLGIPAVGGLVVGLLLRDEPVPGDHGMAGIRASFITTGGVLKTSTAMLRALACAVTTTSGGSAGCEGPVARAAGAVGSWLAQRLGLHRSRIQILAACGVSASLTGLFNTPIAAVVFATEVVLGGYAIRGLAPLVVSAGTATVVVRWVAGHGAPFDVPPFVLKGPVDLVVHLALGLVCGVLAAGFIHGLDRLHAVRLPLPGPLRPALGGLLVGALVLFVPGALGVGYPVLTEVFRGDMALPLVAVLLVGKLVATGITLGSRGAGGVFAPSLVVGAALGWIVGRGADAIAPGTFAPPASFAAAGMVAMVAAVTHAPFTAAVLIVECTRSYHAILPGVVAGVAASMLASAIRDESAYGMALGRQGLRIPSGRHATELTPSTIQPLLDPVRDTVPAALPALELLNRLPAARSSVLVVADGMRVVGVLSTRAVARHEPAELEGKAVTAIMTDTGTLRADDSVARALVQFMRHDAPAMPVVEEGEGLVGLVWRSDLMDFCAHDLLRDSLHLGSVELPSMSETSPRPLRHDVVALPVPRSFVGKTLREVDLGKRFGVVCAGIRRATDTGAFVAAQASPSLALRADDVLILTGNALDLERLNHFMDDDAAV
jgi:CIC family chloride channel protein